MRAPQRSEDLPGGDVRSGARKMSTILSSDGKYRYRLEREWDMFNKLRVCFIMLNPSTADAERDDPTIRRCISFAKRWGYGGLIVVNLYAFRATDPSKLWKLSAADALGPLNVTHVALALEDCDRAIAAWGAYAPPPAIADLLRSTKRLVEAFVPRTKHGHPRHPLYVRGDAETEEYELSALPSAVAP